MNKLLFTLTMMIAGASNAHAYVNAFPLHNLDTNDCVAAEKIVNLLNVRVNPFIQISTYCQPGVFVGEQSGQVYNYQLRTVVYIPGELRVGQPVELNRIDTNNCGWASREINFLNTRQISIYTQCIAGTYTGSNGEVYNSQLVTTLVLNF